MSRFANLPEYLEPHRAILAPFRAILGHAIASVGYRPMSVATHDRQRTLHCT